MKPNQSVASPFAPGWLLGAVLFSAIWLIPNFSLPWLTFDRELLATLLCMTLAGCLLAKSADEWTVPVAAVLPVMLGAVPLIQWAAGMLYFGGDAWMAVLYLFGFGLAISLGANAEAACQRVWPSVLLFAIGLAGIVSVGISLNQWLAIDGLALWVIDLPPGARPFGNIGQPNLLATLLCWGLLAVWWAYLHKQVRGWVALLAAGYLLFGLVMTQSRTAWVSMAIFLAAATTFRRQLETRRYWSGLLALLIGFVALIASWTWINQALYLTTPETFQERLAPGTRLHHWLSMLEAIRERPLLGWGWNQVSIAQQSVAPALPPVPELIHYSHNVVLDLLVWNGIPIGVLVVVLCARWMAVRATRLRDGGSVLLFLAICAFLAHAMLEYPHAYAFMLLPVGMMVGTLDRRTENKSSTFRLPRLAVASILLLASGMLGWTAVEYYSAKANSETLRFEMARVGPLRNSKPPDLTLLTQLKAILTADRMKISADVTTDELEFLRKTSERFPAERLVVQYAAAAAAHGDVAGAQGALIKLCKLYPYDRCLFARKIWNEWSNAQFPFLKKIPFPDNSPP